MDGISSQCCSCRLSYFYRKKLFVKLTYLPLLCYNNVMAKIKNDGSDYYKERNLKNLDKIDSLLEELPPFCEDFLRGVETRTSTLTRLNYVYDLRIFFDFLCKKKFRQRAVADLTLEDLEAVTDTDIEIFLTRGLSKSIRPRRSPRQSCTKKRSSVWRAMRSPQSSIRRRTAAGFPSTPRAIIKRRASATAPSSPSFWGRGSVSPNLSG